MATLIVTNDFPPRQGGIESFVAALAERLGPDVVVYTSAMAGSDAVDAALPFPVIRDRSTTLLPTPRVSRAVASVLEEHACEQVLVGSSVPLGLLAPALREAGAARIVALTHGHEVWWARLPVARGLLRKVGDDVDVLTYISEWCRQQIAGALSSEGRRRMRRLAPGVDNARFRPHCGGAEIRREWGLGHDVPLAVCAARLVKRKGQDVLIESWPRVLEQVPDARLMIVGGGPRRAALERQVRRAGLTGSVILAGPVPWAAMPAYMDAASVFVGPSRTRMAGLEPEGLGIVYLEAAATATPVVVGRSGGAPETVAHGETGFVVDPRDAREISERIVAILTDPVLAARMGARGRAWTQSGWQWDTVAEQCQAYLAGDGSGGSGAAARGGAPSTGRL